MTLDDGALIALSILKFAQDNDLKIHPGQDPLKWAELVIEKGGCPCLSKWRPQCPCEFALEDITELNRCRCGLFVNDAYLVEYAELNSVKARKKKWTRKPKVSSSVR